MTTTSGSQNTTDTSMPDASSANTAWLKENMGYLMENQEVLKNRLNTSRHQLVKMPSIEKFTENRSKLKGFLVQVKL